MFRSSLQKEPKKKSCRLLRFESLEFRELLSISALEVPLPDFVQTDSARSDTQAVTEAVTGQNNFAQSDSAQIFTPLAVSSTVQLAPPKAARPVAAATPTTLEVYWNPPLKTEGITGFDVIVLDAKTKSVVKPSQTVDVSTHLIQIDGLSVKTRYEIQVTSRGETGTSSDRATLKISATTAAFPAVTAKASNLTLSSATLTITDKDKVTPFKNGQTVKTYTIEYVEKTSSMPNWSSATSQVIPPGTPVSDSAKGTITVPMTGLKPGTQYYFRVQTAYADGTTNITNISVTGRQAVFKTAVLPATTISKTFFSLNENSHLSVGLNGKIANVSRIAGMTVNFSLLVSTSTTIEKATGKLVDAQSISVPAVFSALNTKGEFSMTPVDLDLIIGALGSSKMLASKTLSFQLEISFSGVVTKAYSKMAKITMPNWYTVV